MDTTLELSSRQSCGVAATSRNVVQPYIWKQNTEHVCLHQHQNAFKHVSLCTDVAKACELLSLLYDIVFWYAYTLLLYLLHHDP